MEHSGGGGGRNRGSEVNYKSADRTQQGHSKIDALRCELGTKRWRGEESADGEDLQAEKLIAQIHFKKILMRMYRKLLSFPKFIH